MQVYFMCTLGLQLLMLSLSHLPSLLKGGIREAAFAHWPGMIPPMSRSSEIVSSLDLFPTVSALAGLALPMDRVYDGTSTIECMMVRLRSSV
jgi:arylsulfatase A-like enzyme